MSSQWKIAVLLCLSGSAAHAEQTIINLNQAAQTILDQLELSQTLTAGALYYAGTGGVIEAGTMQTASITDQMQNDLNGAISAVTAATYYDGHQLLLDEYDATMVQLDSAVDNLVDATLVLMTVSTLADMAAQADTVQEQLAFQNLLENSPEMQSPIPSKAPITTRWPRCRIWPERRGRFSLRRTIASSHRRRMPTRRRPGSRSMAEARFIARRPTS